MPTKQLSMRKTREILRLKWVLGRSHREITKTLAVGLGTITQVVMRAERAKITSYARGAREDHKLCALEPRPHALEAVTTFATAKFAIDADKITIVHN